MLTFRSFQSEVRGIVPRVNLTHLDARVRWGWGEIDLTRAGK